MTAFVSTSLASATLRELVALGCYWLDLWCLRTATGRSTIERIEVSAEGYTITRVTPDEDTTSSTRTVERYTLPHGFSGGRERVKVQKHERAPLTIEEAL